MSYRFHGTERYTIEIDGWFDPGAVALPAGLAHELADGRARVSLFGFHVDSLRIAGVPLLGWSYAELLWRIAVIRDNEPAWWVIACDLAARQPAFVARRFVRYEVRPNVVELTADRLTSRGDYVLAITLAPASIPAPPQEAPRAVLVGRDAGWQVAWGQDDDARPVVRPITVEEDSLATATLGAPVVWAGTALWHTGRRHRCGVARRWHRAAKKL